MKYTNSLLLTALLLMYSKPVHAYIDPGSGSMFLQIAFGLVVGALYSLKVYWHQLKEFFSKLLKRRE